MMAFSSKKTIYIIDGLNVIMGLSENFPSLDIERSKEEFFEWLNSAAESEKLRDSSFRVVLDGWFRKIRARRIPTVDIVFSEDLSADDWILERTYFLKENGERVRAVTNDGDLKMKLAENEVQTIGAGKFFRLCENAVKDYKE